MKRSVYDLLQKGNDPTVLVLLHEGEYAGKLVAAYTLREAPSGGHTCYATAQIWGGPFKDAKRGEGKAGGGGYCKTSAAMSEALSSMLEETPNVDGVLARDVAHLYSRGVPAVRSWLEEQGYQVIEAL